MLESTRSVYFNTQLWFSLHNALILAPRALHIRLLSGYFPCSQKPCTDGTTCVELAWYKSRCVPTSRCKDDVCMFVCTYVTWTYRYTETPYTCLCVGLEIRYQNMCKWLRSGNNTFRFLLDDAARRICSWCAHISNSNQDRFGNSWRKNNIGIFSWK